MSETKIAPAPWTAKRYPEGDCWNIHYGDKGCWLGEVYIDGDEKGAEAEARLIAAAPTMYSFVASKADSGDKEAVVILEQINGRS